MRRTSPISRPHVGGERGSRYLPRQVCDEGEPTEAGGLETGPVPSEGLRTRRAGPEAVEPTPGGGREGRGCGQRAAQVSG